jgi:hypothetical protein
MSVRLRSVRAWVLTSSPLWKICTVSAVERASTLCPISRQGTEYSARPTFTWMSGPTLPRDHTARVNGLLGSGASAPDSTVLNTASGAAPSRPRCARNPATFRHHSSAARCMASRDSNSRPRQYESRM